MGLEFQYISNADSIASILECSICQSLVDLDALVTVCSHCFCRSCLIPWLQRSSNCPTCNSNLSGGGSTMMDGASVNIQSLSQGQPLAFRMLQRLTVKCPIGDCNWKGDYGDLQTHLISSNAHDSTQSTLQDIERRRMLATSFKEQANAQYESGHYQQAIDLYQKAVEFADDDHTLLAQLFANQAASYLALHDYQAAATAASRATALNPQYVKAYRRQATALTQLGLFDKATVILQDGLTHNPLSSILKKDVQRSQHLEQLLSLVRQELLESNFASAKSHVGRLLAASTANHILLDAAKADLGLGLIDAVLRWTRQVLTRAPQAAEAYAIRGQGLVLTGDFTEGIKHIKEALRLDPDNAKHRALLRECSQTHKLLEAARDQMFHRRFESAVNVYTQTIQSLSILPPKVPLYSVLYSERAKAHLRLKQYDMALKDCALVLYYRDDSVDAWLIRFEALHGLQRHHDALEDAKRLVHSWGSQDDRIRKAYEKADFEVRKAVRPDYYTMLRVSPIASDREIRKAYRQRSLEVHPDRFAGQSDQDRLSAESAFKMLGEGLEIVTDDFKRKLYDEGYDKEEIERRVLAAERAAHRSRNGHF